MSKSGESRVGGGDSLQNLIQNEFKRHCKRGRHYLVLNEVLKLGEALKFLGATSLPDFCHLGVLWVLNSGHDGKVSLDDVLALVGFCRQELRHATISATDPSSQLQGYCSLRLWQALCTPSGHDDFANWICAMLSENSPDRRRFWRYGTQLYLHVDTLEAFHTLLRAQDAVGTDRQTFYDLLQRVGEEKKMMDVRDEELDDWIPIDVLREFALGLARGASQLMTDIVGRELTFSSRNSSRPADNSGDGQ